MLNLLCESDLEICARTVAELGADQPEDVRSSLAWVLRNRFEKDSINSDQRTAIGKACHAVLDEAFNRKKYLDQAFSLSEIEWYRIRALNYLVWAGDVTDQTNGAIACHRHDIYPTWAKSRTPTALLGSFLFFR
jgi:hypothetical protein